MFETACFFHLDCSLRVGTSSNFLGLFAIFGIIRYRTDAIPIKEMTYLFVVIGVSVGCVSAGVSGRGVGFRSVPLLCFVLFAFGSCCVSGRRDAGPRLCDLAGRDASAPDSRGVRRGASGLQRTRLVRPSSATRG